MTAPIHHDAPYNHDDYERLGEQLSMDMQSHDYPEPPPLADDPNPGARIKRLVYQRRVLDRERRQTA